ncbi:NADP-dependent oxidoreductase [Gallaecimonas mangrovi]|uniref:NADP-dependent oxidoreductase n=1 Tax=Gallaecimonas mangrovi TaxID=2291597 RepID=UPI000E1FE4A5|nr:NADP-dependent oxidoreductase [Gallaecimonas mangrovi]
MKAVQFSCFGGPNVLALVDLPEPMPEPGQVRVAVRAAGVNASDWKKRQGLLDQNLPQTLGHEAAGIVEVLGEGVTDVAVGDHVFGFSASGAAQAQQAVLSHFAPMPSGLSFAEAASLPSALETAARALDWLNIAPGVTLLINGASGNVGSAAVQLAVARGARVVGIASPGKQQWLSTLGAEPVSYGAGMVERVNALVPGGVNLALDVAGNGILPALISLTGSASKVVTVVDFPGACQTGVHFSRGEDGRALYVLFEIGKLIATGQYRLPAIETFLLSEVAKAHGVGEAGLATGKLVLLVEGASNEP